MWATAMSENMSDAALSRSVVGWTERLIYFDFWGQIVDIPATSIDL